MRDFDRSESHARSDLLNDRYEIFPREAREAANLLGKALFSSEVSALMYQINRICQQVLDDSGDGNLDEVLMASLTFGRGKKSPEHDARNNAGHREVRERPADAIGERLSFDRIREAREIIKDFKESGVSRSTRERYQTLSERLEKTGLRPEEIAGTKKAFYAYRAAEVFRHKVALKDALRERDKAYRGKDWNGMKEAEQCIRGALAFFARYQPGGTREENLHRTPVFHVREPSTRSNGKRASVSSLPRDWRDRIWNSTPPQDRDAVSVTAVTGLRPSELEKGVRIWRTEDGLKFRIYGTKVDNARGKGQPHRDLRISRSELEKSVEGRHLLDAQKSDLRLVKLQGNAKAFTARMHRTSIRAMAEAGERVSPYTYRHAFSARLKAEGRDEKEIARAMGHQADRSQQAYGRRSQGNYAGGGTITSATAARAVRSRR